MIDFYNSHKDKIFFIIKFLLAASFLFFLINYLSSENIVDVIVKLDSVIFIIAVLFMLLSVYLNYIKWKIISYEMLGIDSPKLVFKSLMCGFAGIMAAPFRIGEYIGRTAVYKDYKMVDVMLTTFFDKILNLIVTLVFGSVISLFFFYHFFADYLFSVFLLYNGICFILLGMAYEFKEGRHTNRQWHRFVSKFKLLVNLIESMKLVKNFSTKNLIIVVVISTVVTFIYVVQYALFAYSFSGHLQFLNFLWIAWLIIFVKSVLPPITIGDIGIREGISTYLVNFINISAVVGFNSAMMISFINIIIPSAAGIFFLKKSKND